MARGTMPPPGASGLAVIIHPGGGDPGVKGGGPKMPPPGQELQHSSTGKADPEEAGVIRESEHCIDCAHYASDSGECEKVAGSFDPQDGCTEYFMPLSGDDSEPDTDDQGGGSDQDADDQQGQAA